ncbi:MAG: hypothetical protein JWO06_1964 [Bacteroidota bacterium]|nr:hypothetical protein [Bacteroidota bacterium]
MVVCCRNQALITTHLSKSTTILEVGGAIFVLMKTLLMKSLFTILVITTTLFVQAGENFSLIEINPLHGNAALSFVTDSAKTFYGAGELTGFTEMDGKLYFSAQNSPGDDELWVTDGTQGGTNLVKAINPHNGAGLGNLVKVGNHILFMATDNGSTWDLWSSDGTDTGTVKIDALNQPSNTALGQNNISLLGNRLLFCSREKLLITDGTNTGTDSLLSISNYSQGYGYCELNGKSYFVLPETSGEIEIWRTDGSASGTEKVLDLADTPFNIVGASELVSFNGKIYLSATASGQSPDLFTYDGNLNGQVNRIIVAQGGNSNPHGFKLYNGALYFMAADTTSSNIYRISVNNPTPVALIPNANFTSLTNLSFANNSVYCMDVDNKQIHAVELSGFTYSSLYLNGYSLPYFFDWNKELLVGSDQQIFFEAYDSITNNQVLMQSDFTATGTKVIMPTDANTTHPFNYQVGCGIADEFDLQMWGNKILLPANFNDAGRELWILDAGIASAVEKINNSTTFEIYPNPASDQLIVKTEFCANCKQSINILDADGRIIKSQLITSTTSTIQLQGFAAGNYFATLNESGKNTGTKQIILVK